MFFFFVPARTALSGKNLQIFRKFFPKKLYEILNPKMIYKMD
jgi:hypothetical protein